MKIHFSLFLALFEVIYETGAMSRLPLSCPEISLKNGRIKKRQRGRYVEFTCNPGYSRAGERHSLCIRKQWDPPPPKCVRPTCQNSKVQEPDGGLIYPTHNGAALHFFCRSGYALKGPSDVFCDGKKWDNNAPVCLHIGEKPQLFCDFEDPKICNWTPDLNHDFDWRREKYNTPSGSIGTGPSFDHTKGNGKDGHYMYIESSSRNENDTARLISPLFDRYDSPICFEFFYHMFGSTIGTLRVYLKKYTEGWNQLDQNGAFFSQSGNKGDKWYRSFTMLGVIDDEFQIVIEGVRGSGYVSDIAIDDVKIIPNCTVNEEVSSTTTEDTANEVFITIDSCKNRCGETEGSFNDTHHLSCDCDDNCYTTNRCCPDYFDECLTGTTDSFTESTPEDTSPLESTLEINTTQEPEIVTVVKTKKPTTVAPATTRTITTKTTTTTTSTVAPPVTNNKNSDEGVVWTSKRPTVKVTTPTTTRAIVVRTTSRKKVVVNTPPTTRKIMRKTLRPTTTTTTENDNDYSNLRPYYYYPDKEVERDEDDEDIVVLHQESTTSRYIQQERHEEDDFKSVLTHSFDETSKIFSQEALEPSEEARNNTVPVVVTGVVGAVVVALGLLVLSAVLVLRRYRNPVARIKFSVNGASASEITFLTDTGDDEKLDLTENNDIYGEL